MHIPVLLNEVLEFLNVKPDGRYIDGTLGLAGHASEILKRLGPHGQLLGLDVDPKNLAAAKDRLQPLGDQTITRQVSFRGLQGVLQELGWKEVDGMLFDLGVSSTQLDDPERGLAFESESPLDMRLDPGLPETAADIISRVSMEELADLFRQFGEAKNPKRIARYLQGDVASGKIKTNRDLTGFCQRVIGRKGRVNPATKIFLALRAAVNKELSALEELLNTAPPFLAPGGRIAVISFHSLEDRLVKQSFNKWSQPAEGDSRFRLVTKKPISPTTSELQVNPRSRSAKLRVLERTAA